MTAARIVFLLLVASPVAAQDLDPRAYVPAPTGFTLAIASVGVSAGDVLLDPTLPVEDVRATTTTVAAGVVHSFGLLGRQATAVVAFPVAWLKASGRISDVDREASRTGPGDPRMRLSVNLYGSPARPLPQFVKLPRARVVVGTSLTVVPPLGQYEKLHLINLGANRWAFKPEIGFSFPRGRWNFDVYAAVWLFTTNASFYPGESLKAQDPIGASRVT